MVIVGDVTITPSDEHLKILTNTFGLQDFRGKQYEAVSATLCGKDSLVILPTGAGKSLTFQFPPYAKAHAFTVVIGPLIALMKDQVEKCLEKDLDAAVYNSECQDAQKARILSDIVSDDPAGIKLLYVTPESLRQPRLREALKEAAEQGTLLSFAVDEAHCASEWGHDFRPAYLELATLKEDFPTVPITALTASCTDRVQSSIITLLKLKDPVIIKSSFNRPNIQYMVRYKELLQGSGGAMQDLVNFIQTRPDECGIIYARTRASCDHLASHLNNLDIEVGCYHAGKDSQVRNKVQREWSTGAVNVVVATIAFGMGIDRADVRWVVHWNVPSSMEGFYQESGRAGRDGLPCISVVYVDRGELQTNQRMEKAYRAGSSTAFAEMTMRCSCRRKRLLEFFGEKRGPCGSDPNDMACDVCCDPGTVRRCLDVLDKRAQAASVANMIRAQMGRSSGHGAAAGDAAGSGEDTIQEGDSEEPCGSDADDSQGAGSTHASRMAGLWSSATAVMAQQAQHDSEQRDGKKRKQGVATGAGNGTGKTAVQKAWQEIPPPRLATAAGATSSSSGPPHNDVKAVAVTKTVSAGEHSADVGVPQIKKRKVVPFQAPRLQASTQQAQQSQQQQSCIADQNLTSGCKENDAGMMTADCAVASSSCDAASVPQKGAEAGGTTGPSQGAVDHAIPRRPFIGLRQKKNGCASDPLRTLLLGGSIPPPPVSTPSGVANEQATQSHALPTDQSESGTAVCTDASEVSEEAVKQQAAIMMRGHTSGLSKVKVTGAGRAGFKPPQRILQKQ